MTTLDFKNLEFIYSQFECDNEGQIFLVAYYVKK